MTGSDPFRLEGQTAVVTGGFGVIGRSITRSLRAAGARLVVLDTAEPAPADTNEEFGSDNRHLQIDMTDLDAVFSAIGSIDRDSGGIDVWVNCAYPRTEDWGTTAGEASVDSWRRNVDMQLNGYCLTAERVAHTMAAHGTGSIINVASIYGLVAPDYGVYEGTEMTMPAAYSAIKGGVIAHTRLLASRYGRRNIRVNAICPGGVFMNQPESFVEAYGQRTALGRMAEADEIGPPVVFLASPAASYVTGAILAVDGGWTTL